MESDEKYIESRFGRKNPFSTPNGYIDGLAQTIMNVAANSATAKGLDTETLDAATVSRSVSRPLADRRVASRGVARNVGTTWWRRYRVYVAAACCAVLLVAGLSVADVYSGSGKGGNMQPNVADSGAHHDVSQLSTASYDMEMDYTMLDNEDIYTLMASN